MQTYQLSVKSVFQNQYKQFVIPVYQRNYNWDTGNCSILFDDIVAAFQEKHNHFLGTIVECDQIGTTQGIATTILVDGQQRLTTLYVFLKALFDLASEEDDTAKLNRYLFNDISNINSNNPIKYKLKLKEVKEDQHQFEMLINNEFSDIDKGSKIWINYSFFKDSIQREMNDNNLVVNDFLTGFDLLEIAVISLQEPNDDPQVVFDRINSAGVPLELPDKIRNYLLMTDTEMDALFNDYWFPMEERVGETNLKDFVLEYCYFRIPGEFNENTAYNAFKNYVSHAEGITHKSILEEMEKCSKYYALYLGRDQGNYSQDIVILMNNIKIVNYTTINPLLFSVFNDFDNEIMSEETLKKILTFLFNYLVRRTIVDVPTNSMRSFFISAYRRIFADIPPTNDTYYESFVNFFLSLNQVNNYDCLFPDNYVIDSLMNKPLYRGGKTQFCKFILASLENRSNNNNEMILIDSHITIEHIMPQTLDKDGWWLEEINYDRLVHESYVHRLGNLSLTGVNSKLSNETFDFKKDIYENTHFNYLYEDVLSEDNWGKDQIERRGSRLASRVVELFPLPEGVTNEMVEGAAEEIRDNLIETHSLSENKVNYKGTQLISIVFDETEFQLNHMIDILETVCTYLYSKDSVKFNNVICSLEKDLEGKGQKPFVSYIRTKLRQPREIKIGSFFIETNMNSNAVASCVRKIFDRFEIDYDSLMITIRNQSI